MLLYLYLKSFYRKNRKSEVKKFVLEFIHNKYNHIKNRNLTNISILVLNILLSKYICHIIINLIHFIYKIINLNP